MLSILDLSNAIGAPESGIKLVLTLYTGYIFALIHRQFLYKSNRNIQYAFFTLSSVCMLYWNYEWDLLYTFASIVVQWLIFHVLGTGKVAVSVSFAFQLVYLVLGYLSHSSVSYDINWCMPQCVLTMRLIGLAFDVYDGHRKESDLSKDQKESAIRDIPSLLEILGFSYFYCGYIVGPQYPLSRFRACLNGELTDEPGKKPNSILPGLRRGLSGTILIGIQAYLAAIFNAEYYTTAEYQASSFPYKICYMAITGHVTLGQYIAVWIINEGSCIISGLGYRKEPKTGQVRWDSVRNVVLHKFLLAESFQDIVLSFNVNTNAWVMKYVFKRLRFVGIKEVSHISTLGFLAIWHGIHEGYFTCFAYEFLTITVEKSLISALNGMSIVKNMRQHSILKYVPNIVGFAYLHLLLGYCLIDFTLLKWNKYYPVHASVYYIGYVFYITTWLLLKLRKQIQKPVASIKEEAISNKSD